MAAQQYNPLQAAVRVITGAYHLTQGRSPGKVKSWANSQDDDPLRALAEAVEINVTRQRQINRKKDGRAAQLWSSNARVLVLEVS